MKGITINAGDNAHITVVAQDNATTFLHTSVTNPTGNAGSGGYNVNDVLSVQTGAAGAKNSLLAMRVTGIKNTIVGPGASAGAIRSVSITKTATLANRIAIGSSTCTIPDNTNLQLAGRTVRTVLPVQLVPPWE